MNRQHDSYFDRLLYVKRRVQAFRHRAMQRARMSSALWAAHLETAIDARLTTIVLANTGPYSDRD